MDQVREIGDFHLRTVPRSPTLPVSFDHEIVPLVYHGSSRTGALQNDIFALRLPDLVNYSTGALLSFSYFSARGNHADWGQPRQADRTVVDFS